MEPVMCHVQKDWFTENAAQSWMTSAMEACAIQELCLKKKAQVVSVPAT